MDLQPEVDLEDLVRAERLEDAGGLAHREGELRRSGHDRDPSMSIENHFTSGVEVTARSRELG